MDRDQALAICIGNLKGSKSKDLLGTAEALRFLRNSEFSSNAKVGAAVGVSGEIVREFLALLRFPPDIQAYFREGRLKLDQGRALAKILERQPRLLYETAQALLSESAMDSRDIVEYVLGHPELSVTESKQRVREAKGITSREFHVVVMLDADQYKQLERAAKRQRMSPNAVATRIVVQSLETNSHD